MVEGEGIMDMEGADHTVDTGAGAGKVSIWARLSQVLGRSMQALHFTTTFVIGTIIIVIQVTGPGIL